MKRVAGVFAKPEKTKNKTPRLVSVNASSSWLSRVELDCRVVVDSQNRPSRARGAAVLVRLVLLALVCLCSPPPQPQPSTVKSGIGMRLSPPHTAVGQRAAGSNSSEQRAASAQQPV